MSEQFNRAGCGCVHLNVHHVSAIKFERNVICSDSYGGEFTSYKVIAVDENGTDIFQACFFVQPEQYEAVDKTWPTVLQAKLDEVKSIADNIVDPLRGAWAWVLR